jgi:hypothetical protein
MVGERHGMCESAFTGLSAVCSLRIRCLFTHTHTHTHTQTEARAGKHSVSFTNSGWFIVFTEVDIQV